MSGQCHPSPQSSNSSSSSSADTTQELSMRPARRSSSIASSKPHKPSLKFVNSTNPDQLRTQPFRKLVKQHAMLDAQQRRRELVQANIVRRQAERESQPAVGDLVGDTTSFEPLQYENGTVPLEAESLAFGIQRFTGCSSVDPFRSLPQYSNALVDAQRLQHLTLAYFPGLKRSQQYVDTLTSSAVVFLADAHPGIILQDALDGNPQGGIMTLAAKVEIYTLLNQRLRSTDPAQRLAPDVIAGVFNLTLLETSYGNYEVITTHMKGLRQMMHIISGSRKAGFDPNLATMAIYQGLETAVYFDVPPEPVYLKLSKDIQSSVASSSPSSLAWESPLNTNPFSKTATSGRSSPTTLWILRSMRHLTTMFLNARFHEHVTLVRNSRASQVFQALLQMPSSSIPCLPSTGDKIYECVRISAVIWAVAITHNIPLPAAVDVAATRMVETPAPISALVDALRQSATPDCWGSDLMGAFMWVVKTGCACCVNGSIPFKWFYLENARAAVHGLRHRQYSDILGSSETMLKVQEGLRSPSGTRNDGVG